MIFFPRASGAETGEKLGMGRTERDLHLHHRRVTEGVQRAVDAADVQDRVEVLGRHGNGVRAADRGQGNPTPEVHGALKA